MTKGSLDAIDRKIIYELDIDSRQPVSKIAKKVRASAQRVEQKIEQYEKEGKILNYLTVVDYKQAGQYTFYVCNLKVNSMSSSEEEKILKKIALMPQCTLAFRSLGAWDILIGTTAKDIFEAKGNFNKFLALFGDKITKRMIITHMGAYHFGRRYLLEDIVSPEKFDVPMLKSAPQPYAITGGRQTPAELDKTDYELLQILSTNARMPSVELAKELKISPEKVGQRIKSLKDKGIIKYFTILIDPENDQYKFYRVYVKLRNVRYEDQMEILDHMRKYLNVYRVMEIFEEYGFVIDIISETSERMEKVLSSLKEKYTDKVVYYDICNIYKMYKNAYYITKNFVPGWKRIKN